MRTKRLLSLVMAFFMLFTLTAPTFAWALEGDGNDGAATTGGTEPGTETGDAEPGTETGDTEPGNTENPPAAVAAVDGKDYADFGKALAAALESGKVLELKADAAEPVTLKDGETLKVKAGEYKITVKAAEGCTLLTTSDPDKDGVVTYEAKAEQPVEENNDEEPKRDGAKGGSTIEGSGADPQNTPGPVPAIPGFDDPTDHTEHPGELQHTAAKAATCTEAGNTEYWYCDTCGKYFSDAQGTTEITLESTAIPALGHTWGGWTYGDNGATRNCSRCEYSETVAYPQAVVTGLSVANPVTVNGADYQLAKLVRFDFADGQPTQDQLDAFGKWYCDYVVYADHDVPANSMGLYGAYGELAQVLTSDQKISANQEIILVKDGMHLGLTFGEIYTFVHQFTCGAFDVDYQNAGTTLHVELRIWDGAGHTHTVNTMTHTFASAPKIHVPAANAEGNTATALTATIDAGYFTGNPGEATIEGQAAVVTFNAAAASALADDGALTLSVTKTVANEVTSFSVTLVGANDQAVSFAASGAKATVKLPVPAGFATVDSTIYVKHESAGYPTEVIPCVVQSDGSDLYVEVEVAHFSTFTLQADNNSVASIVVDTETRYYTSLQDAIDDAASGSTVTLLADVNLGSAGLTIDKALTLTSESGHTYTITSSAAGYAIQINGSGNVTISNVNVAATSGSGIQAGTPTTVPYTGNLTYSGGTITVAKRGINVYGTGNLAISNAVIQSNVADPTATYTTGDNSRGINLMGGLTATITNSTIKGFSYDINIPTSGSNSTVIMTGGATYGRAAVNNWANNNVFTMNGVTVNGINNQTGSTEAFACIVDNSPASGNTYNISNCTFNAKLSSAAANTSGSSATEELFDLRGTNSVLHFTGTNTYTPTVAGSAPTAAQADRFGLTTQEIGLANNTVTLDSASTSSLSNELTALSGNVAQTGGSGGSVTLSFDPEVLYYWATNSGYSGNYYTFDEPYDNGRLAEGEFIRLQKNVTLDKNLSNANSYSLLLNGYTLTAGAYTIEIAAGKTVTSDTAGLTFFTAPAGYRIVEAGSNGTYTYTATAIDYVAQIGDEKYASLEAAVAAAKAANGGTITLLADAALTSTIEINDGNAYTFNLNGFNISKNDTPFLLTHGTLNFTGSGKVYESVNDGYGAVVIIGSNTNAENYSVLNVGANVILAGWAGIFVRANGSHGYGVVVNLDGTATSPGVESHAQAGHGIYVNGNITDTTGHVPVFNVSSTAAVSSTSAAASLGYGNGIYGAGYAIWNLTGCAVSGYNTAVEIRAGELNITGGSYTASNSNYSVTKNGNGSTTQGAAIAVAQHNTVKPIAVTIDSTATITAQSGKLLSVADPENGGMVGVEVKAPLALTDNDSVIPADYKWVATETQGVYTLEKKVYVATVNGTGYETFDEAWTAANATANSTLTLLADVALTSSFNATGNFTLDLNGHNINTTSRLSLTSGTLNITNSDTTDATKGVITTSNAGSAPVQIYYTTDTSAKRTLTIGVGVTLVGPCYGLNIFGTNDAQKNVINVTVNGTVHGTLFVLGNLTNEDNEIDIVVNGTIAAPNAQGNEKPNQGIALNGNADVTVNAGANISGDSGIEVRAGSLTVNGGTISGTATTYSVNAEASGCTTKGAAIAVAQHTTKLITEVTVSNSAILSGKKPLSVADPQNNGMEDVEVAVPAALAADTGTVIPAGYMWVETATPGTYEIAQAVASITRNNVTTYYASLQDAINAAVILSRDNSGEQVTVTLLKDVTEGTGLALFNTAKTVGGVSYPAASGANVKIDFNTHTYTVKEPPVGSTGTENQALHFEAGNTVTLYNGAIVMTKDNNKLAAFDMVMQNYGTLVIDKMTIDGTGIAVKTYASSYDTLWGGSAKPQFNYNTAGSSVIKDSTITVTGDIGIDDAAGLTIEDDATIIANKIVTKGTDQRFASATPTVTVENGAKFTLADADGADAFDALLAENGQSLGTADANGVYTVEPLKVAQIVRGGETLKFASLAEAVTAAQAGETITLLANVEQTTVIDLTKNLTLDLNGKTINGQNQNNASWIRVTNGATLTINGTGATVYGRIELGVATNNNGSVVINGGTYIRNNGTVLHINGTCLDSDSTITGATITSNGDNGIQLNGAGTFVIENSTITGATGVYVKSGVLTITGSTITGNKSPANYTYNGNGANATGDAIVIDSCNYPGGAPVVTIGADNTFSGTKNEVGYYEAIGSGTVLTPGTVTATTNTLTLPDGYCWTAGGNNDYVVAPAVAKIGNVKYATLEAAVAAAVDGDTITLLANCAGNGIKVPENKFGTTGLTIDFDGHTYTVSGTPVGSTGTETIGFQLLAGSTITFKNGTIQVDADNLNAAVAPAKNIKRVFQSYANVTFDDMVVVGTNLYGNNAANEFCNGNVTITGNSSFSAKNGVAAINVDAWNGAYPDGAHVTINTTGNIGTIHCYTEGTGTAATSSLMIEAGNIAGLTVAEGNTVMVQKDEDATVAAPAGYLWSEAVSDVQTLTKGVASITIGGQTTLYASLAEAIADVPTDGTETTITMIADTNIAYSGAGMTIPTNKIVVLELAGHVVTGYCDSGSSSALITNNGTLTIQDSTDTAKNGTGTGKLVTGASPTWIYDGTGNFAGSYATNLITNYGTVTVKSGVLENVSTGSACYAIDNNSTNRNAIANIEGGLVKGTSVAIRQFCNSPTYEDTVNISGGTVTGSYAGIWIQLPGSDATKAMNANLNVTGGTLEGEYAFYDYSFGNSFDATQFTLSGGTFKGDVFSYGASIDISGDATFNGEVNLSYAHEAVVSISGGIFKDECDYGKNAATAFISGGIFFEKPVAIDDCVEGKIPIGIQSGDYNGKYSVGNGWKIFYEKNDASATGEMSVQLVAYTDAETAVTANLTTNAFARADYRFSSWNTEADGSGDSYTDMQEITLTADLTLYAQWMADVSVDAQAVVKKNLTLTDEIRINFKVTDMNYSASHYKVKYRFDGGEVITKVVSEGDEIQTGVYQFVVANCAAKQMCEEVHFELYYCGASADNEGVLIYQTDYSIRQYCMNMINKPASAKTVALCRAVLDYGAAAQVYFNYNTDQLANADGYGTGTVDSVVIPEYNSENNLTGGVTGTKNLKLVSKTELNFKLSPYDGVEITGVTAFNSFDNAEAGTNGKAMTAGQDYVVTESDGIMMITVKNIAAKGLGMYFKVEFSYNGIGGYYMIYSPMTYAYNKVNNASSSEALVSLCKALYQYQQKAVAYFD